jgi:hypothetical protein
MKNLKELLTKEHYLFAEYLGEMILDDYNELEKGSVIVYDISQSPEEFLESLKKIIEEITDCTEIFEDYVNKFLTKTINSSFFIKYKNTRKMNDVIANTLMLTLKYLSDHVAKMEFEDFMNLDHNFSQILKSIIPVYESFDNSMGRLNNYISSSKKIHDITTNKNNDIITNCKNYADMMLEIPNVVDEYNVNEFSKEDLESLVKTAKTYIDGSKSLIEFLQCELNDFVEKTITEELIKKLSMGRQKLQILVYQLYSLMS